MPLKSLILLGLKRLDIFSRPIQLNFNQEKYFQTYIGGIISLLLFIIVCCSVWGLLSQVINKQKEYISRVDFYSTTSPQISFTQNNSLFAFSYYDENSSLFNDPSYLYQEIFLQTFKIDINGEKLLEIKPLTFKKCQEILGYDNLGINKQLDEISHLKLNSSLCLELKNETTLGSHSSSLYYNNEYYFSNILYSIKKCKKDSSIKICKSEKELNEKLRGAHLEFLFIDNFFDLKNSINPTNSYLKSLIFYVDMKNTKIVEIFFKIINIASDIGWIFEEVESIKKFAYDYHQQQNIEESNQSEIIKLIINTSNNSLLYSRVYLKLQEIVGNIGGIFYLALIFGRMITYYQSNFEINERMIHSLFHIIEKNESRRKSTTDMNGSLLKNETLKNELRDFGDLVKANNQTKFKNANDLNYLYNQCARKRNSTVGQLIPQNITRQINTHKRRSLFNFNLNANHDFNKHILNLKDNEATNNESHINFLAHCQRENKNLVTMNSPQKKFKSLVPEVEKVLKDNFQNFKDQVKNKYPLDFSSVFSYYINKLCFKQPNNKYQFYKVAFIKLNKVLDYTNVIKTVKEFKKIKKIILTKNQMTLFSLPKVSFIDHNKVINYNFVKKTCPTDQFERLELCEVYKSYLKAKSKVEHSSNNRKIIENIETNIKLIFEEVEKHEKLK
jgi:hypothetical protein